MLHSRAKYRGFFFINMVSKIRKNSLKKFFLFQKCKSNMNKFLKRRKIPRIRNLFMGEKYKKKTWSFNGDIMNFVCAWKKGGKKS